MTYLGDYADYSTLNFKFPTHKLDGTAVTLSGSPEVSVYKDNSTTQTTVGVTLTTDFDSIVGLNNVLIDFSSDAFYATGSDYSAVITSGTVDGTDVAGTVLFNFSIENRVARVYAVDDNTFGPSTFYDPVTVTVGSIDTTVLTEIVDAILESDTAFASGFHDDTLASLLLDAGRYAQTDPVETSLATTARAELAARPAANAPIVDKLTWLVMLLLNKLEQTATTKTLYADNGSTAVSTSTVSDDGTTFTSGEWS
mgnify:CR=1 FL=1